MLGCLKINTDAAFSDESKQGAMSCIIRDHRGAFYAAQARWYEKGFDACSMEAMACKDSLIFAGQLGVQRVTMETDCLQLVQLWNKREDQRSIIDSTLREIAELSLAFQDFTLSFVSRNCNKVAHTLAKQVSVSDRLETWHVTPACVYDQIVHLRLRPADIEKQDSHKKK